MNTSLLPTLEKETYRIVKKASKAGGLIDQGLFTMSLARSEIEKAMKLDEGELGGKEWKGKVKELVQSALDDIDNQQSQAGSSKYPSPSPSPPPKKEKGKSSSSAKAKTSKEQDDWSDSPKKDGKSKVNSKETTNRKKFDSPTPSEEESEAEEEKEDIESDEEDDPKLPTPPPTTKPRSRPKSPSSEQALKKKKESKISDEEMTTPNDQVEEERQARLSDSDMSSVYDEAPSKSRSKKTTGKRKSVSASVLSSDDERSASKKAKSTTRKKKDPNEGLSKDEAKIADLKRIVNACGVRKQWAKEFTDCPTSSSQIRHIQNLLSSLGMKGTPTLGKAKSLKEKRELAQELDDVQTFEAARGVSSETRASRSRTTKRKNVVASDEDSDAGSEGGDEVELDKEESALGAVLDFLGDDSDSD